MSLSADRSTVTNLERRIDSDNYMMALPAMAPGTGQHTISMKVDGRNRRPMVLCGVVREGALWSADHSRKGSTTGWFIDAGDGSLNGNGKEGDDEAGPVFAGQVVTMQVDLGNGTLKFWVDGKPHGPGYTHGVTGPVQWAVSLFFTDASVQIVPTPELEPWEE